MSHTPSPDESPTEATPPHQTDKGVEHAGKRRSRTVPLLIIVGVLLSAIFAALNGLQLASLQRAVGGFAMPDTRMTGYDAGYVTVIQALMTDELYERYGAAHYLWGILFPVVFAATLILLILRIARGRKMTWLLLPVPVIYAAIDITENLIIESIFSSASIDPHLVAVASTLTILKFVFFVASLLTALIVLLIKPKNIKDNSRR